MKLLALEYELPDATADKFQQYAKVEARRVWELHQAGVIRELYFRADRNEAVLVLECGSAREAQDILSTLPFVQNELIAFDIIPLKAYPGFKRLFATNE
jgi:muconolactone delta-isomerase